MNTDSVTERPADNRPATGRPAAAEKAYSPFVWQQASAQEPQQWAADIDQIQRQLQHLDRSNSLSDRQESTLDPWESDLSNLRQRVQRLNREPSLFLNP